MDVGIRISELCMEKGISQDRLAEMSGISISTIRKLISGQHQNPKIETLHKLCQAFGISLSEFFS